MKIQNIGQRKLLRVGYNADKVVLRQEEGNLSLN